MLLLHERGRQALCEEEALKRGRHDLPGAVRRLVVVDIQNVDRRQA
jgi:hypothetical protein